MKRNVSIFSAVIIVLSFLWINSAQSETVTIKLGHGGPPIMAIHKGALHFQKYLDVASNGTMKVTIFPSGQLGNERVMAEGVQHGTIQMAMLSDVTLSNFVPQVGIMTLPFLFPNRQAVYQVQDGTVGRKILTYFPEKGMIALGWGENGFRNFLNSKKQIRTPSDLKGLKMRCMRGPVYIDAFKALGVNAVPMPWAETISAVKQRVVDGTDLPFNAIFLTGMYQTAKYITHLKWVYSGLILVANKTFYDKLTQSQKRILKEGAFEYQLLNRAHDAIDSTKSYEDLIAKGVQITELTTSEKDLYRKSVKKVHEKWGKKLGEDLLEGIYREVKKYQ